MTSAIDFTRYNAPGVFTQSVAGPQVGQTSAVPAAIGIFGDTQRYQKDHETITIPADNSGNPVASAQLRHQGIIASSIVVSDPVTGNIFSLDAGSGGDYTVIDNAGPDGLATTQDDYYQIKRTTSGTIIAGASVQVSYNYTDPNYYNVKTFYTYSDIVDAYGPAFDASGNIVSELTLAAGLAIANGATEIVAAAVKPSSQTPSTTDYVNALSLLDSNKDISIVCCASGKSAIQPYVLQHVVSASNNRAERRAILGLDGSSTAVVSSARLTAAAALNSPRVALVSPATVTYYNPNTNQNQVLGGQFLAAALAGVAVSRNPGLPLTRAAVTGFADIPEQMTESQKDTEAIGGLMVIEKIRSGTIRVRHGLTTATSDLISKEWSFTGQQDAQAFAVRNFLDNDGIIGSVISDLTLSNVKASVDSALQSLVQAGTIQGYTDLAVRQLLSTPTVIEVAYTYQANVPLNYIVVRYSIDISNGTISTTPAATNTTSGTTS